MSTTFRFKRGTTAQLGTQVATQGEIMIDTSKNTVVVMDGTTSGGHALATDSVATQVAPGLMSATDKAKLDGLGGTGTYTLPTASTTTLGGVKVDGTTITITNGVISAVNTGGVTSAQVDTQIDAKLVNYYTKSEVDAAVAGVSAGAPDLSQATLGQIGNVNTGTATSGQALVFDGTNWIAGDVSGGAVDTSNLVTLTGYQEITGLKRFMDRVSFGRIPPGTKDTDGTTDIPASHNVFEWKVRNTDENGVIQAGDYTAAWFGIPNYSENLIITAESQGAQDAGPGKGATIFQYEKSTDKLTLGTHGNGGILTLSKHTGYEGMTHNAMIASTAFLSGDGRELTNVQTSNLAQNNATDGQALVWSDTSGTWVPGTVAGGGTIDLTNYYTKSEVDSAVASVSAGAPDLSQATLGQIGNVNTGTATSGQALVFDGTNWIAGDVSGGAVDLSDYVNKSQTSKQTLAGKLVLGNGIDLLERATFIGVPYRSDDGTGNPATGTQLSFTWSLQDVDPVTSELLPTYSTSAWMGIPNYTNNLVITGPSNGLNTDSTTRASLSLDANSDAIVLASGKGNKFRVYNDHFEAFNGGIFKGDGSLLTNLPAPDLSGFATTTYVDTAVAGVSGGTGGTSTVRSVFNPEKTPGTACTVVVLAEGSQADVDALNVTVSGDGSTVTIGNVAAGLNLKSVSFHVPFAFNTTKGLSVVYPESYGAQTLPESVIPTVLTYTGTGVLNATSATSVANSAGTMTASKANLPAIGDETYMSVKIA